MEPLTCNSKIAGSSLGQCAALNVVPLGEDTYQLAHPLDPGEMGTRFRTETADVNN